MKVLPNAGWLLAGVSLALFALGILLFFDLLWPWVQLRNDGPIAVGAWIVGALLSASALWSGQRARGWHWMFLGLHLCLLLGLGVMLLLWKPTRLF